MSSSQKKEETEKEESSEGNSISGAFDGVGEALDEDSDTDQQSDGVEDASNTSHNQSTRSDTSKKDQDITTDQNQDSNSINIEDIPHRVKHDSPQENRTQQNFYLNTEDKDRLVELERMAKKEFERKVNKIDVCLAALRSDFRDDESFIEEMEKIGYGFPH